MYARDIEDMLKDYITAAFKNSDGTINKSARQATIAEPTSSNRQMQKRYDRALERYFKYQAGNPTTIHEDWLNEAFAALLADASTLEEGASAGENWRG